ncbi:MAG: hypothetical protein HY064_09180 [Bacteroidetes bacterium]|nr:hypothetical protein [Bacteroidota bacterium]
MKKILSILLMLVAAKLCAQDTIVKKNGDRINANIIEVSETAVKYYRTGMPDSPVFILKTAEISRIIYRNGDVENLDNATIGNSTEFNGIKHRNNASFNALDLTLGIITFNYEFNIIRDKFSVMIPLSSGIYTITQQIPENKDYELYYNKHKSFSTGLNFLFYPYGQNRIFNYYCGLSVQYGGVLYHEAVYSGGGYYNYNYYFVNYVNYEEYFLESGLVNGVLININERMCFSTSVTFGIKYITDEKSTDYSMVQAGINIGYRLGKSPYHSQPEKN